VKKRRVAASDRYSGGMPSTRTVFARSWGRSRSQSKRSFRNLRCALKTDTCTVKTTAHTTKAWTQNSQLPFSTCATEMKLMAATPWNLPPKSQLRGPTTRNIGTPMTSRIRMHRLENSSSIALSSPTCSATSSTVVSREARTHPNISILMSGFLESLLWR